MASVGVYFYPLTIDFGTYLLMLLMGNAILHMMFYTGMKVRNKYYLTRAYLKFDFFLSYITEKLYASKQLFTEY